LETRATAHGVRRKYKVVIAFGKFTEAIVAAAGAAASGRNGGAV